MRTPSAGLVIVPGVKLETQTSDSGSASLLIDSAGIQREVGVRRATAERIMRWCSVKVVLGRRVYVYRAEVLEVVRLREVRDTA